MTTEDDISAGSVLYYPESDTPTPPGHPVGGSDTPAFDERYREPLQGLLFLGGLRKSFEWLGHSFYIRTLRTGEFADVAAAAARWRDTAFGAKAYQAACVAACLISVDGQELPGLPLTTDPEDTTVSVRTDYVLRHWFPPIIDQVYSEYWELEVVVRDLLENMGKR